MSRAEWQQAALNNVRENLSQLPTFRETHRHFGLFLLLAVCYPETTLPLGYEEIRYASLPIVQPDRSESFAGIEEEVTDTLEGQVAVSLLSTTQFRSSDGVWHDAITLIDRILPPQTEPGEGEIRSAREWATLLRTSWLTKLSAPVPSLKPQVIAMPALHLPPRATDTLLQVGTARIIGELVSERCTLDNLHWRVLEELVADLLSDMGLRVTVTERSNDGGRDVVAKGELIPGEPMTLAVEVKHRKVVDVGQLREALWANRQFPALLFVTSGRFTAGVFEEQRASENRMRLFLKDRKGLAQWLDQYARRRFAKAAT